MNKRNKKTKKDLSYDKPSTVAAGADDVLAPEVAALRRIRRAPVARTTVSLCGA